ncbi:10776_t:CDS:2 [Ambispora gerdemannii]|uniref:10776_t:CDS:1 n=1 Tax=Ambispora gerdemannii TaxID=144530 RepID=A0A9N9A298_9GLOM|nr:10776_t:CDS:2 [Ambispora gerdemannii]
MWQITVFNELAALSIRTYITHTRNSSHAYNSISKRPNHLTHQQLCLDLFVRLKPTTISDDTPSQGILFGIREECLDRGLVIQVKGFIPYISSSNDLVSTISKYMNWNGQTVLGWFASPTADVFVYCDSASIASAYFSSIQKAMLKVIAANYLSQHPGNEIREIAPLIVEESCALFQDLIGMVIGGPMTSANNNSTNPSSSSNENFYTKAQAFVSTPTLTQVLNRFQTLTDDVKGDISIINHEIVTENTMPVIDGLSLLAAAVSTTSDNNPNNQKKSNVFDEEGDHQLGDLNSVWRYGQATSSEALSRPRTRRASTTDIADPRTLRTRYNKPESQNGIGKKRKDVEGSTSGGRSTKKKTKTTMESVDDVIPIPFNIIPGQGSDLHHSTDFDESFFPMHTASFFTPIENSNATEDHVNNKNNNDDSTLINAPSEQRINLAFDAITYHLKTHTQEKIDLYEKSCREYEMLLDILEGLGNPEGDDELVKRLELSLSNGQRSRKTLVIPEDLIPKQDMMTPLIGGGGGSCCGGERIKEEKLINEKREIVSINTKDITADLNVQKMKNDEIPELDKVTDESNSIAPKEDNNLNGNCVGAEASLSSTEDGEIEDDETGNNTATKSPFATSPSKDSKSTSNFSLTNTKNLNSLSSSNGNTTNVSSSHLNTTDYESRQLEKSNAPNRSPGWAWDDEEIG